MNALLQARDLSFIRGERALVDHVSLEIGANELVGLVGPNGAGKSTLLDLLVGLSKPDTGDVLLKDKNIKKIPLASKSRMIGWVEQSGPINWPLAVEKIIALGRRPHLGAFDTLTEADSEAIEYAISATNCEAFRNQDATTLSGGERTRMMLARALAAEPQILLADEPIAALDLKHQLQIMQLLSSFATGSNGCLVVLHDLSLAARYCDRLYLMKDGVMLAHGSPLDVLTEQNVREAYEVDVEIGSADKPYIWPLQESESVSRNADDK